MGQRTFQRTKGETFVGSVSAIGTLNKCRRWFYHSYVDFSAKDNDYVSPKWFAFGHAVHYVLEMCDHNGMKCTRSLIEKACALESLDWDTEGAKVAACLRAYFSTMKPMNVIAKELEIITDEWVMYIDAVLDDGTWWYISDVKTTGKPFDSTIRTKLIIDPQMVLYAKYAYVIAEKLGLDIEKFYGINYREIEKPRERPSKSNPESWEQFTQRCTSKAREIDISKHQLLTTEVLQSLNAALIDARMIRSTEDAPQNTRSCKDMGHVCPFYSRCYGKTYTESQKESTEELDLF